MSTERALYPESAPLLGLLSDSRQVVVVASMTDGDPSEVGWHTTGFIGGGGWPVSNVIGWMELPGSNLSSGVTMKPVPITEVAVYRATLEACVQAEASDQVDLAKTLRAWVDASPFNGCPTGCNGRAPMHHQPVCSTCGGEGFVPDAK